MKFSFLELQKLVPKLHWSAEKTAENLSLIGHETETLPNNQLEVTLTPNRRDCQDIRYLAFDLAGCYPELAPARPLVTHQPGVVVPVTIKEINKILGTDLTEAALRKLEPLGFEVTKNGVIAPDFRADVSQKYDIAEELSRVIGYDQIGAQNLTQLPAPASPSYAHLSSLRALAASQGWNESIGYSFTDRRSAVKLQNPHNRQQSYMRPDLQESLLLTLAKNPYLRRTVFYEIGDVYCPTEQTHFGLVLCGYKNIEAVQIALRKQGIALELQSVEQAILDHYNIKQSKIWYGEMAMEKIPPVHQLLPDHVLPIIKPISSFPPLVRDFTLAGEPDVQKMTSVWRQAQPEYFLFCEVIDQFTTSTGEQTTTYRVVFQKMSASFTKEEIERINLGGTNLEGIIN